MSSPRIILKMGMGNDLYGEDYTKAACRAIQDALHHSSLVLFRSLDIDPNKMEVTVTIGVQQPKEVDKEAIKAQLPYGEVTVRTVMGGLNMPDHQNDTLTAIASAAVEARCFASTRISRSLESFLLYDFGQKKPDNMIARMPHKSCETVWRKRNKMGVRFIG